MFSRWGAFVYRSRRAVALLAIVVAVAALSLASQASSALSSGGWLDLSSESADVSARLDTEYGAGKSALIAVFRSGQAGADATSAAFQGAIATAVTGLQDDPRVTGVVGYGDTGDARFISRSGDAAYVLVQLDLTDEDSVAAVDDLRAAIAPPAGYAYQLTGYGPITRDSATQSEEDLQKAETVSLPIAALVLILVTSGVFTSLLTPSVGQTVPIEAADHVPENSQITWKNRPPSSGPHYPVWSQNYGVLEQGLAPGYWVHNLEHGAVAVLYNCPDGCPDIVQQLKDLYPNLPKGRNSRGGQPRVLIVPYTDMDTKIAAVAWGWLLKLDSVDADKLTRFVEARIDRGPECQNLACP